LLLVVFVAFLVLNNMTKSSQETLHGLEEELLNENNSANLSLKEEIMDYQRKIDDFSKLAGQHLINSELLGFIEGRTHPKVWFSKFNLNTRQAEVLLSGQAQSFESLGQQLSVFRQDSLVRSAALEKVSLSSAGGIEFNMRLSMAPEIFTFSFSQSDQSY